MFFVMTEVLNGVPGVEAAEEPIWVQDPDITESLVGLEGRKRMDTAGIQMGWLAILQADGYLFKYQMADRARIWKEQYFEVRTADANAIRARTERCEEVGFESPRPPEFRIL
jgi:hypothetical protein